MFNKLFGLKINSLLGLKSSPKVNVVTIEVEKNDSRIILPTYATGGSLGFDIRTPVKFEICPGQRLVVPTGLKMKIPTGFEIQIRSKSGLALNHGIVVLNSPGTIDEDFRGEIGVILINHSNKKHIFLENEKIAQGILVYNPYRAMFKVSDKIDSDTDRGEGGFGSTGK